MAYHPFAKVILRIDRYILQRRRGMSGRVSRGARGGRDRLRILPEALRTEVAGYMRKDAIIFFDKLGFGWVVDSAVIEDVQLSIQKEEELPSRSLIKIIENILWEKPIIK